MSYLELEAAWRLKLLHIIVDIMSSRWQEVQQLTEGLRGITFNAESFSPSIALQRRGGGKWNSQPFYLTSTALPLKASEHLFAWK